MENEDVSDDYMLHILATLARKNLRICLQHIRNLRICLQAQLANLFTTYDIDT